MSKEDKQFLKEVMKELKKITTKDKKGQIPQTAQNNFEIHRKFV